MENKDRSLRKERNDNRGTVFFFFLSIVPMDMVLEIYALHGTPCKI